MKILLSTLLLIFIGSGSLYAQNAYGSDLSVVFVSPTGTNAKYFKEGFGAIGGGYYENESGWRIGLTVGFLRNGLNSTELNNHFQTLGQPGTVDIDGALNTIPILLSAKYLLPGKSVRFYGLIEGGLYMYWYKATGTITYTGSSPGTTPIDKSEFSSEWGYNFGLGALFPVNKEVSIDANVRYHIVRNSGTIDVNYYTGEESVGSSHLLSFGLGVNWYFIK